MRNVRYRHAPRRRAAFTLIELLVTILIISLMSMALIAALGGVRETARQMRTQQFIMRLSAQIMPRYHSYKSRQLPVDPFDSIPMANPGNAGGNLADRERLRLAWFKLWGMRSLMMMEMPDCYGDLMLQSPWLMNQSGSQGGGLAPYVPTLRTAYIDQIRFLTKNYSDSETALLNKLDNATPNYTGAECLYLIVESSITDRDLYNVCFNDTDIADVNQNGIPEFVDAWGNPIWFLRWPAGFVSPLQPMYRFKASANVPGTNTTYESIYGDKQPYDPASGDGEDRVLLTRFPVEATEFSGRNETRIGVVGGHHDSFDPLFVDRWEPSAGNTGNFSNGRFTGYSTQPSATAFDPPNMSNTAANKDWGFPERSFNLVPLIVSGGMDREYGLAIPTILASDPILNIPTSQNPYLTVVNPYFLSKDHDIQGPGQFYETGYYYQRGATDLLKPFDTDNIHNHRSAVTTGL